MDLEMGLSEFRSLSSKLGLAGCGWAQHQGFASPINFCFSTPPKTFGAVLEVAVVLPTVTQNQRSPTMFEALEQSPTSGNLPSAELSWSGQMLHASPCSHCCCPTSRKPMGFCLHGPPLSAKGLSLPIPSILCMRLLLECFLLSAALVQAISINIEA